MRGRGWRAVLCFSPQSCGVPPHFWGAIGSPFRTEILSGIRLGYRDGRGPFWLRSANRRGGQYYIT